MHLLWPVYYVLCALILLAIARRRPSPDRWGFVAAAATTLVLGVASILSDEGQRQMLFALGVVGVFVGGLMLVRGHAVPADRTDLCHPWGGVAVIAIGLSAVAAWWNEWLVWPGLVVFGVFLWCHRHDGT